MRHGFSANRVASDFVESEFECLKVQVGDTFFCNVHRKPGGEESSYRHFIQETIASHDRVVILGDHNADLASMHFPGAQTYGSLDASGRPIPSRVQGERCIDFFVARGAQLHNVHNCVETLGDHYMIAGHVTTSACSSPPMWRAKPTTRCPKPETVTGAQWAQQQRAHWMQLCTPEDQGDTEAEWQWFNAQAEEAMRRAYRAASQVIPDPPQRRPKGSTFSRVGADTLGAQSRSGTSFRLRKWLKLQGRLREAQRQMIRADVGPHLWSNIRARWPSSLRPLVAVDTVDTALVLVAEAIEEHQAAKRLEAIHRWQQQLARRGKEAIRWLKGTSSRVAVVRRAEGASWHTAAHHAESLSMIKTYWSSIWNRQLVDPARAVEAWARHGHSARFQGELAALWTPVKLHQQACTMGASAAGPDGWSGDEIRTWPREAWNHFAVLLDRWVRRGSFPCAWQELRQIHIPKDEPELDDGSVDVQNMRPISVMSALWRCVSSCIAKDDSTLTWLNMEESGGATYWATWRVVMKRACRWRRWTTPNASTT